MEPVISSAKTLLLEDQDKGGSSEVTAKVDKFKVATTDTGEEADGWGEDEFLDWGSQDEENKLVPAS
jgi:hypothetical protein